MQPFENAPVKPCVTRRAGGVVSVRKEREGEKGAGGDEGEDSGGESEREDGSGSRVGIPMILGA